MMPFSLLELGILVGTKVCRCTYQNEGQFMNLERYKYHVVLASYLEAPPIERFSALRHEVYRIVSTYCGYAEILRIRMAKIQEASQKLLDFLNQLNTICLTLRDLMETTRFKTLTEGVAEEGLLTFWAKHEVVELA